MDWPTIIAALLGGGGSGAIVALARIWWIERGKAKSDAKLAEQKASAEEEIEKRKSKSADDNFVIGQMQQWLKTIQHELLAVNDEQIRVKAEHNKCTSQLAILTAQNEHQAQQIAALEAKFNHEADRFGD